VSLNRRDRHVKIRLARAGDIPFINAVSSHKDVAPYISDGTEVDFKNTPPTSLTFVSEYGYILFIPTEGDDWEFHTAFLPEGRGRHSHSFAKQAITQMFDKFSASALVTYTPDDCPHARPPKTFGFKRLGRLEKYVRDKGADIYYLTPTNWKEKQCRH
jgi:hypothetical protein